MAHSRRAFLAAATGGVLSSRTVLAATPVEKALASAHTELWKRFIERRHFTLLDCAALDGKVIYPTGEELRLAKPNALAWGTPVENGAFHGGLYLDALCNRWRASSR